jgi:hypothetical protein
VSFANRRFDNGADSGTVVTIYNLTGGVIGPELACSVTPQASNVITTRFPQVTAKQEQTFLVEVSATTFGAPAGAVAMGGNLALSATLLN